MPLALAPRWDYGRAREGINEVRSYLLRRLLLVVPTLLGIIAINFVVVQFAPGGPVEQALAEARGNTTTTARVTGAQSDSGAYRGARGLDNAQMEEIRRLFGFDKPPMQRFVEMVQAYLRFDLGRSFFRNDTVLHLLVQRLPVSISLGLWSTLIIYLISVPLGILKAVRDGSRVDIITSAIVLVAYAIPGFLLAILLIVLFAGGSFVQWFPLRGLATPGSADWTWGMRVADYAWHLVLPTIALVMSGFAGLTILTKNSFLEEVRKNYVATALAKGSSQSRMLYGHVFRNAILLIVAGLPSAFLGIFFSSALLVEIVFSIDGLGLLGFESAIRRDYPVIFGTLYVYTLLSLLLQIVGDLLYTWVDPRINFGARR